MCSVNGERLFLKGANLLPTRAGLADATPAEMRRDIELAVDAGLDVLRVHGHIAPRPLYDAADELGMLLMQDFPLLWGYARSVRGQAVDQARAAVDQLGHHPAIVMWTAHNDPAAVAIGIEGDTPRSRLRYLTAHQLPSWNKTILDRWVKRSFEKADPTRPCIPHSGVLPHLPQLDGTDSHFYFGWYHGDVRDLDRRAAQIPRLFRFLSEFGAQAVPESADFIDPAQWPDLDWDMLDERHGLQKWVFDTARAARPVRHVRRVAPCHAGVPSRVGAPPHRVDSPVEVPPGGRVRPVLVQRPGPDGVVQRARPRARPQARLSTSLAEPARP